MTKPIRNFVARDQLRSRKAKKLPHKNDRRAKDARKHWKNEDHSNLQNLIGKTITKVDTSSVNVVYLEFSDGTNVVLDTEYVGHGIYGICGNDPANYGDSYNQVRGIAPH